MRRLGLAVLLAMLAVSGCADPAEPDPGAEDTSTGPDVGSSWVYQLEGYADGGLEELAAAPQDLAVIDLARDGGSDYFTAEEVQALGASGKTVLAYFSIGSIENYRPEAAGLSEDVVLNRWPDWPDENFVRYWDQEWWESVVKPRVDQALDAGFDGIYLDVILAYEDIDLALVPGETRESLAQRMTDLVIQISEYARERKAGFRIFPQNSPELVEFAGYTEAIDGIGMEDLYFSGTDDQCDESWCQENLDYTRRLRDAGKLVLAVDYADKPANVEYACEQYADEGFVGYVAPLALDRVRPPCP